MDDCANHPKPLSTLARMIRLAFGGLLLCFVGKCVDPFWNWPNYQMPANLKIDAALASDSESGLMEACRAAIYKLAGGPLMQLKQEGISYLNRNLSSTGDQESNPYGPWRETPGDIDLKRNGHGAAHTIFGLYALGRGCRNGNQSFTYPELSKALTRPGSFYATTGNLEGIIIVAPTEGLAADFYVG